MKLIGFFDECIEIVESVDKYVFCDGVWKGEMLFVYLMNWWWWGEDFKL